MQRTGNKEKDAQRSVLAADVARFQAEGGVIYQATHEDSKMYRDRMAKHGPYVPLTVSEARMNHRWRTP